MTRYLGFALKYFSKKKKKKKPRLDEANVEN